MAKKYKLFKICKELNLGHETIIGFLLQKGEKVSGPNSSISEEIYLEIVEKFATDKEKADKLRERRKDISVETEISTADTDTDADTTKGQSEYMKAIKKSIEDRTEELTNPIVEVAVDEKQDKQTHQPIIEVEPKQESIDTNIAEIASVDGSSIIDEVQVLPSKIEENTKPQVFEKIDLDAFNPKKKKKLSEQEEEGLSEKEKKRLKALEMIRKDGKKSRAAKPDIRTVGIEGEGASGRRKKVKKPKRKEVDLKEVQDNVKKTLASIDIKSKKSKRHKKIKEIEGEIIEENIIEVTEFISANDLANLMEVPISEIITKCLELGLVVSINQRLDIDTITLLAEEYDFKVELSNVSEFVEDDEEEEEDKEENLKPRSPIVTIMGHVDHGKTSLLDFLRKSNVAGGESGGITQHVAAYEVEYEGKKITFLDTPGHEAFTAMRARGAQITDIVILVIAADDAVMPQTDEALDHAKAAGVKIVIAINKIDKPGANPEKIRQQLSERDILVEDWGGSYQCAELSALSGKGVPELLEKLLLEAEMLDLKANPDRGASGYVVESRLDKGKGAIATVLIQSGTLRVGDNFISGQYHGKVRALLNEKDEKIKEVGPSQPALITGFMGVPQAGDKFIVKNNERSAKEISNRRQQLRREQDAKMQKHITLDQISEQILLGETQELNILVKADVDGSAEALADSLLKLNTSEVKVNVVRKAVGPISESDVLLASASGAVIIGFHIRANAKAKILAEKELVDIRIYQVVYDAINEVKLALEGLLKPHKEEVVLAEVEVRDLFKISRLGVIAGCYVLNGKINRNNKIHIVRDDVSIFTGSMISLKRFKDDVKDVATGFECGIQIENYNDLKVGDIIQPFEVKETKRKLEAS